MKVLIVILPMLLLTVSARTSASDAMMLHHYDSSVQWRMLLESTIQQLLERLISNLRPVHGKISSHFGLRYHPIRKLMRHHDGIDIACPEKSEVRAVLPGTVKYAGRRGGYGLVVIIEHPGEITESRYAHLSKLLVSKGDRVARGEMIALSGSTGLATGPHLHFELYRDGKAVDPEAFMANDGSNPDESPSAKSRQPATSSLRLQ